MSASLQDIANYFASQLAQKIAGGTVLVPQGGAERVAVGFAQSCNNRILVTLSIASDSPAPAPAPKPTPPDKEILPLFPDPPHRAG